MAVVDDGERVAMIARKIAAKGNKEQGSKEQGSKEQGNKEQGNRKQIPKRERQIRQENYLVYFNM